MLLMIMVVIYRTYMGISFIDVMTIVIDGEVSYLRFYSGHNINNYEI